MIEVKSPVDVIIWKKKYAINLNQYRNWHYMISNKIKHEYCANLITPEIKSDELRYPLTIEYQPYWNSRRRKDKWNVLSIVQKFFLDTLVVKWIIPDDNDQYIGDEIMKAPIYTDESESYVMIRMFNHPQ